MNNTKLIFKVVKNQLKKQVEEKNPKLLILSVDFIKEQCTVTTDTNDTYEVHSPGLNVSQLKMLIADKLKGRTPRKMLLSFYYIEKSADYYTIIFKDESIETVKLYKN
jgi:DeoR/GlpR family transcriptional regulator of sugar metabolism